MCGDKNVAQCEIGRYICSMYVRMLYLLVTSSTAPEDMSVHLSTTIMISLHGFSQWNHHSYRMHGNSCVT